MRLKLATKITMSILGVLLIALVNGVVGIFSAYLYRSYVETVTYSNLASVRAAEELEIALLAQRGYVSSYVLDDGQGDWLDQLEEQRKAFSHWLAVANKTAHTDRERTILEGLEAAHAEYAARRDQVVDQFDRGNVTVAKTMVLREIPMLYDRAYALCEQFIATNNAYADQTTAKARSATTDLVVLLVASATVSFGLGGGLLWMFLRGVVWPLRRVATEMRLVTGGPMGRDNDRDDMADVGRYMRLLMADVAATRLALERSQGRLEQAERLASVGKLAASVAHEIRNPLTAMKMWLFSIRREVGGLPDVRRQFDSIADEIARLENIVHSFLEFSRPPNLRLGPVNVAELLEKTLELVGVRLADAGVELHRDVVSELPLVTGDSDQLRQVFLNLLNNSLDAMPAGGRIVISVAPAASEGVSHVVVRVTDTGMGMTDQARSKLFQPFFSTKQNGTGLGLCVAASIIARHEGSIRLEQSTADGTTFSVWIPVQNVTNKGSETPHDEPGTDRR